ncbi:AhpC-TSA-domain-containing protein [Macrolepiota fuliginosa MF-IS2]|uniref:thioredoxin-dependent peroxiredoxin n=1 Tax=Macrolepiota fuliginosa MF-IS2 TaxID=1400762 RepID=A0A9P6C5Z3_9AGAR|nr:AhpC-TSA-domain-containing protein [Macrolepiota fuliginosa MF-IS2]
MPRKAAAATAGEESIEQAAPRRSTRIATQPKAEESKPAPRPRATKKRTVDDADAEGAPGEEQEKAKGKAKKAKAENAAEAEAEAEGSSGDSAAESTPQLSPIDIGDTLPSLTLKNEKGEDIQVAEIASDQGAVVFLVPKADTPGCTNQACGFRDIFPNFTEFGYTVYCLSADSPNAQSKWQTKKELPYSLISDPKRILIGALGANEGGKTKRSHFIFEKGGKLVEKQNPVKPVDSPKLALEFIQAATASS